MEHLFHITLSTSNKHFDYPSKKIVIEGVYHWTRDEKKEDKKRSEDERPMETKKMRHR